MSLAAIALVPGGAFSVKTHAGQSSFSRLSYASLSQHVHTVFKVVLADGQEVKLTLLKAPIAPTRRAAGRQVPMDLNHEKFSLIFSGPKETRLDSAIHQFEHRELGQFEMHIGQIGMPGEDGLRYEAVFNQPVAA